MSTRVADTIQQQMTPAQQEYWTGENGYFSQVRQDQQQHRHLHVSVTSSPPLSIILC